MYSPSTIRHPFSTHVAWMWLGHRPVWKDMPHRRSSGSRNTRRSSQATHSALEPAVAIFSTMIQSAGGQQKVCFGWSTGLRSVGAGIGAGVSSRTRRADLLQVCRTTSTIRSHGWTAGAGAAASSSAAAAAAAAAARLAAARRRFTALLGFGGSSGLNNM